MKLEEYGLPKDAIDKIENAQFKQKKFVLLCKEILGTPRGKELMDMLDEYLMAPVAPHDREVSYAYFREGENNIIRLFKRAINEKIKG